MLRARATDLGLAVVVRRPVKWPALAVSPKNAFNMGDLVSFCRGSMALDCCWYDEKEEEEWFRWYGSLLTSNRQDFSILSRNLVAEVFWTSGAGSRGIV